MANTKIQIKRTSVTGRTPNTSDPANTSYIAAGEFALNMADKILYTSNGSSLIAVGASQDTVTATQGNFNNISTDGGISIGNSTVNASINSTSLFAGNAASNVVVNTTILTVSNTTTNSTVTSGSIFTGNSTANAQFNIGIGTVSLTINSYSYSSTTGIATFTTSADHGLSGSTKGLYVTVSGLPTEVSTFNGTNEISTLPANNQFTIKKFIGGQIVSASRTNGVATVTTKAAHGFATNDVIGVSGINPDITYAGFNFNGTQTVTSVPSSTTFTYANYPKINATISSFYVNTSESKQPVYVTGTAHGFATNMPVSTTTTIEANVTANVYGFFLNPDSGYALGPKLGFDVPSVYLVLGSGTNINNFSSGIKMSVATPGPQYSSYTSASNTSSATARLAQVTNVYSESATTTSTNYIVVTNVAHGLTPDSYVLITGVPTGCTTVSSAVNSSTTLRRVIKVNGINAFTISAGTSKTRNIKATGDFTNANLYVYIPSNLGIPSTSPSTITIVNDDLIRLDFPSTSAATSTTLNTTQWNRYGHPKIKFRLDGAGWTRTANTVRVNHSSPDYNIFSVDDYIGIVCYSQDNAVYFSNVKNPDSKFLWSKITAANTAAAWFEFTVDSSKFSGATSGTFGTSTAYGFDYFFKPFRTQSASNTTFNFRRTYTNAPVQYVNSTAFRIGSAPTVDDNLFTSNIASSSARISLTTGAVQANTDRASSAVIVSSGALAGPGTISTTSTSASACTFISPYAEVANSSATVKITASTFYNGNSTANVFVNSTSFEVATSTDRKVANSSAIVMGQLSGGVLDTTKPSFFANSSYIQIGPDSSRKFWRAGIIGGVAKTEIGGSEFSVGTETNNTTIVDSSITLTDGIVTNYISSNGIQLNSNVDISGPLSIANNYGSAGQILYTDGANPYWGDVPGFDSNIPYTFYQPLTLGNDINSNGVFSTSDEYSNYAYVTPAGFDVVANNNQSAALFGNGITFTSNSQDTATSTTVYANSSVVIVGNSTVNATVNSTAFTGSANNSSYLGGTAAASYVQNTDSRTLSGNLTFTGLSTFTGNVVLNTVSANGTVGTDGQVLTSNGTVVYWSTPAAASGVNTAAQFTWTNTHSFNAQVTFNANIVANSIVANGSLGSDGQVLTSNGSTVYWSTPAAASGVNTAAQFSWTNTHSFSANVTFSSGIIANGSLGTAGQVLTTNGTSVSWTTGVGATGGGTDRIFYENDITITSDYTITTNKNAMTAGPITINSGVTVTIPNNSVWTIV